MFESIREIFQRQSAEEIERDDRLDTLRAKMNVVFRELPPHIQRPQGGPNDEHFIWTDIRDFPTTLDILGLDDKDLTKYSEYAALRGEYVMTASGVELEEAR